MMHHRVLILASASTSDTSIASTLSHRLGNYSYANKRKTTVCSRQFSKYPPGQKARVIHDKRTTESKWFGFAAFSDGSEYFRAAKVMQGRYIGSHSVLLKASAKIIPFVVGGGSTNCLGPFAQRPSGTLNHPAADDPWDSQVARDPRYLF